MQLITFIATLLALLLYSDSSLAKAQPGKATNGCTECHVCSTPTVEDPCLRGCPRPRVTPQDLKMGPDRIVINEIEVEYEPVNFAHRLHAEMTAMDRGCQDCHHFQEIGGITACKNCHPADAADENLDQPSLKGAYHRQCLGCHQDWSHDTACEICHVKKGEAPPAHAGMPKSGSRFKGLVQPEKKVWNSTYGGGSVVTLFHRNHTDKYGIDCASCHHAEGCASCHSKSDETATTIRHSEEALHSICNECHAEMSCEQCHLKSEAKAFSHDRTGWPLKGYHERLTCKRCHGDPHHFTKPPTDCNSCHKSWDMKTFNHKLAGLALNETHVEISCEECHTNRNFALTPTCAGCHDAEISFPTSLPGTKLK